MSPPVLVACLYHECPSSALALMFFFSFIPLFIFILVKAYYLDLDIQLVPVFLVSKCLFFQHSIVLGKRSDFRYFLLWPDDYYFTSFVVLDNLILIKR